jgi:tetratricopeptide (TPR) repeat protein
MVAAASCCAYRKSTTHTAITMNNPQEKIDFSSKAFLIIDDFEDMHTLLRQTLKSCGANTKLIDDAHTGSEAVKLLGNKKYDVVLCDYNLGAGKTGQNILEEAKHRELIGPACAWLMITAEKTNDIFMGTAEAQPDDYLLKPITAGALQLRLAKIWNKKKAFIEIAAAVASYDYPGAIKLCDERLAFDEANAVDLLKLKAKLLLDSGNTDGARRTFEKAVLERNLPWAKVGLAKVKFQEGDINGAKSLLENVVAGNPYYLEAYDWLTRVCQAQGKHDEAEKVLEKATLLSPNSIIRQKALGDVSLKLGKIDNAEKAFKKSIGLGEHSILKTPDAYTGLAKTCSANGNPDEALRILDTMNKDFDNEGARFKSLIARGIVHQQSGDPVKAREVAQELSERMKSLPQRLESDANLEMAQLFLDIGEKEAAVSLLQEEVKNHPENAEILEQVKQVFVGAQMGEHGIALIESTRKSAIEQMNRGVLLAHEGKIEDAIIWMRNAREAMPTNARVLFNLAYVLITHLKKIKKDLEIISEAREILIEAHRLAPGEKRFTQLMESLKACN